MIDIENAYNEFDKYQREIIKFIKVTGKTE